MFVVFLSGCEFNKLLRSAVPEGSRIVPSDNCTKDGLVPDGGSCSVSKEDHICGPVRCTGDKWQSAPHRPKWQSSVCVPKGGKTRVLAVLASFRLAVAMTCVLRHCVCCRLQC